MSHIGAASEPGFSCKQPVVRRQPRAAGDWWRSSQRAAPHNSAGCRRASLLAPCHSNPELAKQSPLPVREANRSSSECRRKILDSESTEVNLQTSCDTYDKGLNENDQIIPLTRTKSELDLTHIGCQLDVQPLDLSFILPHITIISRSRSENTLFFNETDCTQKRSYSEFEMATLVLTTY